MNVLIDTNVLSELRRPDADERVKRHLAAAPHDSLFVSVVSVGEIVYGFSRLAAGPKKRSLMTWLANLEEEFRDAIVPIDLETCRIWGELTASRQAAGHSIETRDGLLAATAVRHGMHLMTRNTKDFANTGVLLINPWEG
jgi:predicted nucleic acid-binding protein